MATERLDIIVRLNDASKAGTRKVKANLQGISTEANQASKSMKGLGASLLSIAALFTAGRGFANAINTFKEFDDAMRQAGAVTNATAQEMEDLISIAEKMGSETRFTASQAAEGLRFLGLAGFEAAEAVKALPSVLQLASAGSLELGQAADITTNILAGFGMEVDQLGLVNDQLVKTFTSSNNSLIEIGEAFKLVGPIAKGVGGDFSDLLASIGKLGDAGLKASIGGTSLRGTLAALFNPTKQEAKLMDELSERIGGAGLQITKTNGDFIGFAEIIQQLEVASITGAEALELFGLRAGPGVAALINQGSESLFELREEINKSRGTAESIAKEMEAGLGGAIRRLDAASEKLKLTLIGAFGDDVSNAINHIRDDILGLTEAIEENQESISLTGRFFGSVFDGILDKLKQVGNGFLTTGKLIALLGFTLSKVSFTATVKNTLTTTKLIQDELKTILRDVGLLKPEVIVEVKPIINNRKALDQIEAFSKEVERIDIGALLGDPLAERAIDTVSLEAQLKSGLIKLNAILDTESAKIKAEFDSGIIDLDTYFDEREAITRRQLGKELELLRFKLQQENDLSKSAVIESGIFAKQKELDKQLIELQQEKFKEFKKLEKEKDAEIEKNLRKRIQSEKKAQQADDLINDLKIRNLLTTSNELEDIFKNEQIKLQKRQREELEAIKSNTDDEIKLAKFASQQKIEIEKLTQNQRRRLQEKLNKDFNDSEKLLNDLKVQNLLDNSEELESIHANELVLLKARQQQELDEFIKHTDDMTRIKEFTAQQDIERDKRTEQQRQAISDQRIENTQKAANSLSSIADSLFELTGQKNKNLFRLSQAAAITEVVINAAVGASQEFRKGGVFGIITGAAVLAAGAVQIAKIKAQKYPSYADGGVVQGHSPHSRADNIQANLTAGEGVLNVPAMRSFGPDVLNLMNKQAPTDQIIAALSDRGNLTNFSIPKKSSMRANYADGGVVGREVSQNAANSTNRPASINIINVSDPSEIGQYLNTNEGKAAVVNVISSRAKKVKRILNT